VAAAPRTERPSPEQENLHVSPHRRTAVLICALTLGLAGCGGDPPSASHSPSSAADASVIDLSAIACATEDPTDSSTLTGAWSGNDGGTYYIRHVGNCVWWFATTLEDLTAGRTGQIGLSNVATGRIQGTHIEVEYVDLPAGEAPAGGGGLTLEYDVNNDLLTITEQRGDWTKYAATTLTRIRQPASPEASPSVSASP
jgi:hypothetical protein